MPRNSRPLRRVSTTQPLPSILPNLGGGRGDADLVISHCLFEHVSGTDKAWGAVASILKPGGRALIFVPSRNAVFARLNLLLPEGLKRKWLAGPSGRQNGGWRAYYDRCTPRGFRRLATEAGLTVERVRPFYVSGYFRVFAPLYLLWRVWIVLTKTLFGEEAAETFIIVARRPEA